MAIGLSSSSKVVNDLSDGNRADSCYHVQDAENLFSGDEKILTISDFKVMGPNSYSAFMSFINVSKNPNIDSIYAKKEFPDFKHGFDLSNYNKVYAMYLSQSLKDYLLKNFSSTELTEAEKRVMYRQFEISLYSIHSPAY